MFRDFKFSLICVLLAIGLLSGVLSAGTMQFQDLPAQNQFKVTYGDIEITFGNASKNFAVNGIKHLGQNAQFGKWPTVGTSTNLWLITFVKSGYTSSTFLLNILPSDKSYSFDPVTGLTLHFDNLDLPGWSNSVDVTVRVKPLAETSMTGWHIEVENRSGDYAVAFVEFPMISFDNINGNGASSCLSVPKQDGVGAIDPVNGSQMRGAWVNNHSTVFGADYPSPQFQMQYSSYYQEFGDVYYPESTRGAGLYLATHDPAPVHAKSFAFQKITTNSTWLYICTHHADDVSAIGADYVMPYDHRIGVFEGDWYDAAQIYRKWALQQDWTRKGPIATRTDIPDWYKTLSTNHRASSRTWTPAFTADIAIDLKSYITGPMAMQWYQWGASQENDRPSVVDAPANFATVVGDLHGNAIYPFLFITGRLWAMSDPGWPTAGQYASLDRSGNIPIFVDSVLGNTAFMCFGTSFWRDYQANVCADIVGTHGVKGLYLDQLGGISYGCFDPTHGHLPGFNQAMVANNHLGLEAIEAAVHAVDPNVMFWGEESSEISIDILHGKGNSASLRNSYLPLYSAVYHDYMPAHGSHMDYSDVTRLSMQGGWQLTAGAQLGRIWPTDYVNWPTAMGYASTLSQVKNEAWEYLNVGKMMRPPVIDTSSMPTLQTAADDPGGGSTVTMPIILGSVWRNHQGQIALVVTNISSSSHTFNVEMDLDEYGIKAASIYDLYEFSNPASIIHSSSSRLLQFSLTLSGKEAKVYELSVPTCSGFALSDTNLDCMVNFGDFSDLANGWMVATDFTNLLAMTEEWLTCADLSNSACE